MTPRTRLALGAVAFVGYLLLFPGCDCAGEGTPAQACTANSDCPTGQMCVDTRCQSPQDAGDNSSCIDPDGDVLIGSAGGPEKARFLTPFGHFDGGIADARRHALFDRFTTDFLDPSIKPCDAIAAWEHLLISGSEQPPTLQGHS